MADPSGNKTAFVLSGARPEDYQSIAKYILEETDYGAEQVAFVKSTNAFDMSGMEFCGNAARAFALMSAKGMIDGKASPESRTFLEVSVSDGRHPVVCGVDTESGHASASIPLPKRIKTLKHCDFKPAEGKTVLIMEGIAHLIADDIEYSEEGFDQIRQAMQEQFDPEALGCVFLTKTFSGHTSVCQSESGSGPRCSLCLASSGVQLSAPLWAPQAPLSTRLSRQGYWSGCHAPFQWIFPTQESDLQLRYCRQILDLLSHPASLRQYCSQSAFQLSQFSQQRP